MNTDQITKRLDAIKATHEKATPGPWHIDTDGENGFGDFRGSDPAVWKWLFSTTESGSFNLEDAEFIASARTTNPALERALRIAVEELKESHASMVEAWECTNGNCCACATLAEIQSALEGKK